MKIFYQLFILLFISIALASCSTSSASYAYDDLYYNPKTDPIKQVQQSNADLSPRSSIPNTENYPNRYTNNGSNINQAESYNNRYIVAENEENQLINNTQPYNSDADVEYFEEDYAATVNQISSPVRSLNTHDVYQRDRILYTADPFFARPALYNPAFAFTPIIPSNGLSLHWNSIAGWNAGFNYGYTPGFGYGSCLPPVYRNYRYGYYDPFRNYAFYDPFWGANRRFNFYSPNRFFYGNRFYGNNFYTGRPVNISTTSNEAVRSRRQISVPRGSSGSKTTTSQGTTRPTRIVRSKRTVSPTNTKNATAVPNRQSRAKRPTRTEINSAPKKINTTTTKSTTKETPRRYQTSKTPNIYNRPSSTRTIKSSTSPSRRPAINPAQNTSRPVQQTHTRPARHYNASPSTQPKQQVKPNQKRSNHSQPLSTQPKQQSKSRNSAPTYNRSRPSYNKSKPSYSRPSTPSRSTTRSNSSNRSSRPSRR